MSVSFAVVMVIPIAQAMGGSGTSAAAFAGLVALFAAPLTIGLESGTHRWGGVIAIVPCAIGIMVGLFIPRQPMLTIVVLALVAALAVWVRRFGTRIGGLGQLMFVVYYFALVLGEGPVDARELFAAGSVGLASTWLVSLLPGPAARRVLDGGLGAMHERVAQLMGSTIDIVSTARHDRRLARTWRDEQLQLQRTATAITAHLGSSNAGTSAARARTLRIRVFDVQLAAENLMTILPVVTSGSIAADVRARLAAELAKVQGLVAGFRPGASHKAGPQRDPSMPSDWPRDARRIRAAILELRDALEHLRRVELSDDSHAGVRQTDDAVAAQTAPSPGGFGPAVCPASVGDIEQPVRQHGRSAKRPSRATIPSDAGRGLAAGVATRQAVQAGLSTGLALFFGGFVSTSHQYWVAMPAFQVLSDSDGQTRVKALQRIVATILGSGIAFGLAIATGHNPYGALLLLIVSVFFMSFLRSISTAWTTFWQMLLLAAMYDVTGVLNVESVEVRIAETAIGSIVAMVISAVVLPTRTRTAVLEGMAQVVGYAKSLADAAFAKILDAGSAPADLTALAQAAGEQLVQLESLTAPQRRNPGALQRSGVVVQLASLWSLLYYEEQLAHRVRDGGADLRESVDWVGLRVSSDENFAAVQAVLGGELPQRVHVPADLDVGGRDASPPSVASAVIDVQRISQSLLALMDAVKPGTLATMRRTNATAGPNPPPPTPQGRRGDPGA